MTLWPEGLPPRSSETEEKNPLLSLHVPREIGELAHLLFEWPIRQAPRLALPAFILLAAFIQGGMMMLFSISYTPPSAFSIKSPQIYFLPPDSAIARKIAPWLEANDPAIFSPQYATRAALPDPPPLKYRPSYEEPPPPLRPLPSDAPIRVEPPLVPFLNGFFENLEGSEKKSTSMSSNPVTSLQAPSVVLWQGDLENRAIVHPTKQATLQPLAASLQPTLYEVGVSAEGIPMHCVLLDSSGDSRSDEAGSIWIDEQRFQPSDKESWGRAMILWGSVATPSSNLPAAPQSIATPEKSPSQP